MPGTVHLRAKELFLAASELPESERAAFLDAECGADSELRREVETLLEHAGGSGLGAGKFLDLGVLAPLRAGPDRFTTGEMFAGRYRIVSLAGRGGMGEVWRAHDVRLDEPVALKFVAGFADREVALREARLARRVTHPNVCRVHDVGEFRGETYISMEWVDGEDLRALLDRIGRLPPDKVLDLARQIAAALAAAHAEGILHRDLKPANVLIDRQGIVRLTDFGIAGPGTTEAPARIVGTPAYMAPELLEGAPATVRSDVWALGVLLRELVTGVPPRAGESGIPLPVSLIVPDVAPELSAAIARATEGDPELRFPSVVAFAGALPGGDVLAFAREVGLTPSPEMVAAARPAHALAARSPLALAVLSAVLLALAVPVVDLASQRRLGRLDRSPQFLAGRSDEILRQLGWTEPQVDRAYGFVPPMPQSLRPERSVLFWYRSAPVPIASFYFGLAGAATYEDPSPEMVGGARLSLDTEGRLVDLDVVPQALPPLPSTDWRALFAAMGVAAGEDVHEAPAEPLLPAGIQEMRTVLVAGSESHPPMKITAASTGGRVFAAVRSIEEPAGPSDEATLAALVRRDLARRLLHVVLPLLAIPFAFRNLRGARGDLVGSLRVTVLVFSIRLLYWLFRTHHVASLVDELELLELGLAVALERGLFAGICYLAFEPFVRRGWARALVGWNRIVGGRFADPVVGRSLLVGVSAGAVWALLRAGQRLVEIRLGIPLREPVEWWPLWAATDAPTSLGVLVLGVERALFQGFLAMFAAAALRRLPGARWHAVPVLALLLGAFEMTQDHSLLAPYITGLSGALSAVLLVRFGVLTYIAARAVAWWLVLFPLTTEIRAWYAPAGGFAVLAAASVAAAGYWATVRAEERKRTATATY